MLKIQKYIFKRFPLQHPFVFTELNGPYMILLVLFFNSIATKYYPRVIDKLVHALFGMNPDWLITASEYFIGFLLVNFFITKDCNDEYNIV